MRRGAQLVVCVLLAMSSHAQWGINMSFRLADYLNRPDEESNDVISGYGPRPNLGLGIDVDVSERSTMGLDIYYDLYSVAGFDREVLIGAGSNSAGIYRDFTDRSFSVIYRSAFCARSNDKTHFYFGPFVGIRGYTQEIGTTTYSTLTYPLGMRFGFRGAMDGGFGGFFTSLGTQLGRDQLDPVEFQRFKKRDQFPGFIWEIGACWGFGSKR